MPALPDCLLCGAPLHAWFAKAKRHFTRCPACGLVVVPEGVATNAGGVSIYEAEDSVFAADGNDASALERAMRAADARPSPHREPVVLAQGAGVPLDQVPGSEGRE